MSAALPFKAEQLGEIDCQACGWEHAAVRANRKGLLWYHCDACLTQHQTRTVKGTDGLKARMRPLTAPAPESAPSPPEKTMPAKKPAKRKPAADDEKLPPRRTGKSAPRADDDDKPAPRGNGKHREPSFGETIFGESDDD